MTGGFDFPTVVSVYAVGEQPAPPPRLAAAPVVLGTAQSSPTILAIDPGTHCGWAVGRGGKVLGSGVWDLKAGRWEGGGMRWVKLRRAVVEVADAFAVDLVAYEEVRRHMGTDAAHVYGGIVAVIQEWAEARAAKVPYYGLPVGTVKKHATGKGNADKAKMIEAAQAKWPARNVTDDNEADALWILSCATAQFGGK